MKNLKYIIVLLLFTAFNQNVFGAIERFSTRKDGDNSTDPLISGSSITVYDDKYFDMSTDPFWSTRFANKKATGYVRLGINPDLNLTTSFTGSQDIEINYWKWNTTSGGFDLTTVTRPFSLSYSTSGITPADDQSTFSIEGAQRITIRVLSGGTLPLANLYVETGVEVERYYMLDNNPVANLVYTILNPLPTVAIDGPQIEFRWDTKMGAEFYELEWVHVNNYTLTPGSFLTESQLNYNFYLNSTRIETKQNWYKIPHIFDHGYIVFRVRPIGKNGADFAERQDGTWSVINESGTISSFPNTNKIPISSKFSNLTWTHAVTYAEDGKRFESLSYADGLGRTHQSFNYNSVNNQVIVSNLYYDELGRTAVRDLPTPISGAWMKFKPNFNRANLPGSPSYSWQNFDSTISDSCRIYSTGFATTTGAGQYYSPSNTNQNGSNIAIPDAEKHPFSRTVFTNDYSNRISQTAIAGNDLKIGSGKETKVFYPSSNQSELDQLFGSEVGDAKHYEKMISVDPNGQILVQYSDMAGRIVASYMEGPSPNNVTGIEGNASTPLLVTMIDQGAPQQINTSVPYSEISYSQYISSDTTFNFNYYFTPSQFESACTGNLCLDCIYDLSIEVFDNCGQPVTLNGYTNPVQITGSNIDSIINGTCNGDDAYETSFSANLTKGMYTIHKKLTVNEQAIDDYWCLYLEANNCIEGVQSIFDSLYLAEPFSACEPQPIEEVELDECESAKALMLLDVSPGGQYGLYNGTTWTSTDAYSVYNPSGQFGVNWRTLTYLDANSNPIPASTLAGTAGMQWFVNNFREEWAEVLLAYHPEKCYLDFCFANSASNQYNNEMLAVNSFEGAKTAGFLMPLTGSVPNNYFTFFPAGMPSYLDPFFHTGGMGVAQASTMLGSMNHYADVYNSPLSMWEYAVYMVSGAACRKENLANCMELDDCNKDLVWLTFRELYLQDKATQVFLAQQAYAAAHGCSNDCIGKTPPCSGTPAQLASRSSRFGNLGQFASTTTNPATQADSEIEMNALIAEACSTSCEGYADQWLSDLAGCAPISTLTTAELDALRDELIELCMLGCDKNYPMGSTTAPPGEQTVHNKTDIQGVLDYHLNGKPGYPNENCSAFLISVPGPYQTMNQVLGDLPIMDQCGCDVLMDVRADYLAGLANNTIPATTTLEAYLNSYNGIDLDDVDNLLCVCDQFYDEANNNWLPNANASILAAKKYVPKELTCEVTTACKTCDEVSAGYTEAYAYVYEEYDLDATEFEESATYKSILTAFLNAQFGYDLTFMDYDFFRRGCLASSAEPVCELNPVMNEFKDMMSLLAMRGQFVHSSPLNLVTENIVYKHGKLREDEILGSSYSTTTSSGHLIASFQTGSQSPCIFDFSVAGNPTFDFSKVVSFGEVWATTTNCTANTNFEIEVKYYECGQLVTKIAQVSSACLQVNFCSCGDNGQRLCDEPLFDPNYSICYQPTLDELMQNATEIYEASVSAAYALFKTEYKSQCAEAFSTEHFDMQGRYRFYQYTLFYYDQAGNLVKTVAPKGVTKLNPTQVAAAQASRNSVVDVTSTNAAVVPTQEYITKYQYNSYGQLVSSENPDKEGMTRYWYDFYGRLVLSQNPQQAVANKYSYTLYDKLGRVEEAGQVVPATSLGSINLKVQDPLSAAFKAWVRASGSTRTEVTKTYYDRIFMSSITLQAKFTLQPGQITPGQQNLRLRIASVAYYNTITSSTNLSTQYTSAIHYTYDLHGNVLQSLQDVPALAPVLQDVKSTEYDFELISGNVKSVKYQKDQADQLTHNYVYDKMNRLEEVFVSTDKIHQSRQAHYLYYEYGPVARVELGEQKVQGTDYAYTINGWLKAMNGTVLNPGYELGRDNASGYLSQNTSVHNKFAKDVVGSTIGYFNGDYQSIGSTNFAPSPYGVSTLNAAISQLYNGNIAYSTNAIADVPSGPAMAIQMGVYKYDQLNQLVSARTFRAGGLAAGNNWSTASETQEYKSTYSYDQNGNIKTLLRNGGSTNLNMDNFVYQQELLTTGAKTNRLDYVDDNTGYSGNYTLDIDDQASDNYGYDKLGQLVRDNSEGSMTIEWFSGSRKVKKITRTGTSVAFEYNAFGQRIMKTVDDGQDRKTTYYTYDANGQLMAVYTLFLELNEASLEELHIYGASRLGIIDKMIPLYDNVPVTYTQPNPCKHTLGHKRYEITNHLGNVNAVITDRKLYVSSTYEAVVVSNSDYYPFGMPMPGRNTNISNYRFGYNGMEMDNEIKNNGNSYTTEFRQYDPRLGRWLSLDPLMAQFPWMSPYVAFDNNPVFFVDREGLKSEWHDETDASGNTKLVSDPGDDINTFKDWYKNSGLKLTPAQYSKLEADISNLLNNAPNEIVKYEETYTGLKTQTYEVTYEQKAEVSYNLSNEILNVRIHLALENRDGIGGSKDGHVGLEFQGSVYHYFWDTRNGTTFSNYLKNPFYTEKGMVYVDKADEFANLNPRQVRNIFGRVRTEYEPGHGYHRGGNYNKHQKSDGKGQDFYTTLNLSLDQYIGLGNQLSGFTNGTNYMNYGLFKRQFVIFGKPQIRCMSFVFLQMKIAGVNFGITNFEWIQTVSPLKLKTKIEENGHKFTELKVGDTYVPLSY